MKQRELVKLQPVYEKRIQNQKINPSILIDQRIILLQNSKPSLQKV